MRAPYLKHKISYPGNTVHRFTEGNIQYKVQAPVLSLGQDIIIAIKMKVEEDRICCRDRSPLLSIVFS